SEGKELVAVAATRIQLPSSEEQRMKNARYIEVVRILSARGAEVDIHSATAIGDADYVEKLLKRDPSLGGSSDGRGVPVFQRVVWLNNKKILVMFLDHGVDVDLTDQYGLTALDVAAFLGFDELAKLLIERKANVNAASNDGYRPLHFAVRQESLPVVRLLLAAGAKIDVDDNQGRTPLRLAEEWTT